MKNVIILQVITLFIISCSNGQDNSLTANEIFEKHLKTIGEKEQILNIKTYSYSMTFDIPNYGNYIVNIKNKIPDKIYVEKIFPDSTKEITIFNKDKGVIRHPANNIIELSNKQVQQYKNMALVFTEFYFKELGYEIEMVGQEKINGVKCYKLEINTIIGKVYYLISKKTFRIFQFSVGTNGNYTETIELKNIGGVNVTKTLRKINGEDTIIYNYYNHLINSEINDSIFTID